MTCPLMVDPSLSEKYLMAFCAEALQVKLKPINRAMRAMENFFMLCPFLDGLFLTFYKCTRREFFRQMDFRERFG